jgi:hypothetical protein
MVCYCPRPYKSEIHFGDSFGNESRYSLYTGGITKVIAKAFSKMEMLSNSRCSARFWQQMQSGVSNPVQTATHIAEHEHKNIVGHSRDFKKEKYSPVLFVISLFIYFFYFSYFKFICNRLFVP